MSGTPAAIFIKDVKEISSLGQHWCNDELGAAGPVE